MREEIEEGEEDGEGFLHAEESVEGPFSVELNDWLRGFNARVGYYMLTGIIAFGGTSPEEKSMVECYSILLVFSARKERNGINIRIFVACPAPLSQFSRWQTCLFISMM